MAQDPPAQDLMHYDAMAQEALRGVVRSALKRAATEGLPGAHHFYITFKTDAPGVSGPNDLLSKYPDEMTIVLQHQYWDLAPGETFFSVTLQFSGQPKRLSVPYGAVTRFYDPSVQFLLQFEAPPPAPPGAVEPAPEPNEAAPDAPTGEDGSKIVSLDQFRKK
ncbi:MAG: stringent starvation protein B [Phenylobacterium sp.]|nr:MAG: stringent starvation protein B [Phenylobacterium sp.]